MEFTRNGPEQQMIEAKREFHLAVARAWYQYDEEVETFRVIRDRLIKKSGNPDDLEAWKAFDEATFDARIRFEKAVMSRWQRRAEEIDKYREKVKHDR
jgi:hypothetical protein